MNKQELRNIISINDPITMSINYISRDGMSRHFSIFAIVDNKIKNITNNIADLLGCKAKRGKFSKDYILVGGCGMDMCNDFANRIKRMLYTENEFEASNLYYYDGAYKII